MDVEASLAMNFSSNLQNQIPTCFTISLFLLCMFGTSGEHNYTSLGWDYMPFSGFFLVHFYVKMLEDSLLKCRPLSDHITVV